MTNIEESLCITAFLLGKVHTSIYCILNMENTTPGAKIEKLAKLEAETREAINKLYYPVTSSEPS